MISRNLTHDPDSLVRIPLFAAPIKGLVAGWSQPCASSWRASRSTTSTRWTTYPCVLCIHVRMLLFALLLIAVVGVFAGPDRGVGMAIMGLSTVIWAWMLERSYQLLGTERGWIMGECQMAVGPAGLARAGGLDAVAVPDPRTLRIYAIRGFPDLDGGNPHRTQRRSIAIGIGFHRGLLDTEDRPETG